MDKKVIKKYMVSELGYQRQNDKYHVNLYNDIEYSYSYESSHFHDAEYNSEKEAMEDILEHGDKYTRYVIIPIVKVIDINDEFN